ncbi:MAG: amidase [Gammaproteobacteria bacterium]|nr:amidase [Gammaproteobacteria bacterium]
MREEELAFASINALCAGLASGDISSPVALTQFFLERSKRLNVDCHAFIEITEHNALRDAKRLENMRDAVPLRGIPFASKDLFDVEGVKTTAGSRVLADNTASADATVIKRLRNAGAVNHGKLNLHEFAYGITGENVVYGTPVNAYDKSRLAGGSSSGSAAAVAFGLVPFALGTDTGGSTRVPAAFSGLVGLKPTFGRVSRSGIIPYSWSLDHVGTITRTVADAALILQTIAGEDKNDPDSSNEPLDDYLAALEQPGNLSKLKIGVPRAFFFENADSEILAVTELAIDNFRAHGAQVVDVELPKMEHTRAVSLTVQMPEALSVHSRYLKDRGHLYSCDFRAGLALGQCLLAEHYIRAKRMMTRYRQQTNAVFEKVDLLITPTTPIIAPRIGQRRITIDNNDEAIGNAVTRYTSFFNMTGHPALTVPSGLHSLGLPMGVQIIGRYYEEAEVLIAGLALEENFQIPKPSFHA